MRLLDEKTSNLGEVIDNLNGQKSGTPWAEATNHFAVAYAQQLEEKHGNVWYKGCLTEEDFNSILLPEHGHGQNKEIFFPLKSSLATAKEYYKNVQSPEGQACLDLILHLKEKIRTEGFTSNIALTIINGKPNHLDGVHRVIALSMLLDEGFKYKPIYAFVWDPSRI